MTITTLAVTCKAPADATVDRLLIQTVAALNGVKLGAIQSGETIEGSCTTTNKFTGQSTEMKSLGLIGTLKLLTTSTSTNGMTDKEEAEISSWMQSADQSLLVLLRSSSGELAPALKEAGDAFCASVDAYLAGKGKEYLVGTYPTLADVVVATAMAAYSSTSGTVLPKNAYKLSDTVLKKLSDVIADCDKDTASALVSYTTKMKEGGAAATAPVAAAPAAAAADAAVTPADHEAFDVDTPENNPILKLLSEKGITHQVYGHTLCMTAEDLVSKVPIPDGETHTKNLFLRDKKFGHFLVTVHPNANVQTKDLGKMLGLQGKTNLRLADEKILDEQLKVKAGCVGPLCVGLASNMVKKDDDDEKKKNGVTFVIDKSLFAGDSKFSMIHSHALRNDQSVKMTPAAMKQYFDALGVEPIVLEFAEKTAEQLAGKAPANRPPESKSKPPQDKQQQPKKGGAAAKADKKTGKKGETLLALQWKKAENFPMWYTDVIVLSEMISYYDISGCYILRPWSYKMWHLIQIWFDIEIEKLGVENSYFPLFVSQDRLEKEKDHVEGFAPEVAWVTKSGSGDLAKPIAVRPTSETIMYPAYSDWIKSHRDLPLKLNQWSNVVRWEFKYPTPFLRTREFLWQEGHTAHASFEDAEDMVMKALDLYRQVYEDLLAVPVVPGYKTEKEKFAGGFRTTTVEAYIAGSGRAIQGATSHNLGQNFGKMFDITYQDEKGESQVVWQTSWGLTTRTIGVMVMVHGDDQGLVLPPRVAPLQVVIVPIISKKLTNEVADPYCNDILKQLKDAGIRAKYDDRTMYNPGWKYNHWEQKGVPIRLEVGPKDMETKSVRAVVRHDRSSENLPIEGIGEALTKQLAEIQSAMFQKAKDARDSHVVKVTEWKDFVPNLEKNNLVLTPWCGGEHQDWEEWVKTTSREESLKARGETGEDEKTSTSVAAKTLCIPFDQPELPPGTKCIASGLEATCWVLWGRSY